MNKIKYFIVASLIMSVINFSCKKDSSSGKTTVEYVGSPMDIPFPSIVYNGANGAPVQTTGHDFAGSKSISVASKPFDAKITAELTNTLNSTVTFSLTILVNGKVMAQDQGSAPPNSINYMASAEYTVQ